MGTLVFQATLGGAVNIIGPNIANTINFTLPSADGTSGQTWTTNGSGVLAFGTLGIAGGGTGQITATAAFNALAPSQSGQSGKYLTTDGTNTSWGTNPLGTVTSVAATVPSFLSIAGSPITTSGTLAFTLSGTALPTTSGGTGLTSFTSGGVVYASSTSALATGSALTFDGTNLILGSASPNFQGSSSIGSVTLINNSGGAHVRAYGGSHATRADFTEFVNGATTSFINSSGNFGLAVTPSTWSVGKSFEIASVGNSVFGVGAADMRITAGAYYNAAWKYAVTGSAITKYEQTTGVHTWWNAPSGTAGNNATFTQAMTLTAAGNLGVGTTSPLYPLQIGDGGADVAIGGAPTGNGSGRLKFINSTTRKNWQISTNDTASGAFEFTRSTATGGSTFSTPDMVISSSGNVGIGTSSPASGAGADRVLTIAGDASSIVPTLVLAPHVGNAHELISYNGTFSIYNSTTLQASLNNSGGLKVLNTIGVGNATPSTSGAGITFPADATASASSNANTLDDYEEGTWTPALGGFSSITYSAQTGTYTKIGNVVNVVCKIVVSGGTRTVADAQIFSLPFTSASQENSGGSWGYGYGVVASTVGLPQLRINASATTVSLLNTAGVVLSGTDLNTATPTINFSATYTV